MPKKDKDENRPQTHHEELEKRLAEQRRKIEEGNRPSYESPRTTRREEKKGK